MFVLTFIDLTSFPLFTIGAMTWTYAKYFDICLSGTLLAWRVTSFVRTRFDVCFDFHRIHLLST